MELNEEDKEDYIDGIVYPAHALIVYMEQMCEYLEKRYKGKFHFKIKDRKLTFVNQFRDGETSKSIKFHPNSFKAYDRTALQYMCNKNEKTVQEMMTDLKGRMEKSLTRKGLKRI